MFVNEPSVKVIGRTKFDYFALDEWAEAEGLSEVLKQRGTPLNTIAADILGYRDGQDLIEFAGRHCYRAWRKGRPQPEYISNLISEGHESVLEHASLNFAVSGVSRTLTHELIRHRVGIAISQESQRYVDAADIRFVVPPLASWLEVETSQSHPRVTFEASCQRSLDDYKQVQADLQNALWLADAKRNLSEIKKDTHLKKRINEAARSVLHGSAETRLTWTANYRTLRHFFAMRGQDGADLEIRRLAVELFRVCKLEAPLVFADFEELDGDFGVPVVASMPVA